MRSTMAKGLVVLAVIGSGAWVAAQDPKPEKAEPSQLDKDLAAALGNNPDIQVAEAQLREAQAELNRVQLGVMQKVVGLRIDIDAQKRLLAATEEDYARSRALIESGVIPPGEAQASAVALEKARADLARLEAEFSALKGEVHGMPQNATDAQGAIDKGLFWLAHHQLGSSLGELQGWIHGAQVADCAACHSVQQGHPHGGMTAQALLALGIAGDAKPEPGSMTDRILNALETPIQMEDGGDIPVRDFLEYLRVTSGEPVPFRVLLGPWGDNEISQTDGELPLGAWLLIVQDSVPNVKIYLRPYGLLITTSETPPEKAIPLSAAWPKPDPPAEAEESTEPEE